MVTRALGPLVVFASGVAYVMTAAQNVVGGDNGEMLAVASGGVSHPPGYPFYALWLRALRFLSSNPAHAAALATAVLGVLSVWLVQRAARAWGVSLAAAAISSAIFGFSSLAWQLATHAEVFALNVVLALAIVTFAAPDSPHRGPRLALALGLLAGLGLANHHSIVLVAPIGICAVIRAVRTTEGPRVRVLVTLAALFGGLAVGMTPYLYAVHEARTVTAQAGWVWGDAGSWHGFVEMFLRREFGTTQLGNAANKSAPLEQLTALGRHLFVDLLGLPLVALAAAALAIARRRLRLSMFLLAASFVLAGPVFVAIFNLPPRGVGARIVERFHLLPEALLAVLGALSLDAVAKSLLARPAFAASLTAGVVAVDVVIALPEVNEHHRPTVQLYVENALKIAPPNAIILGNGDARMGGFLYARYALRLRPDVVFINPRLLLGDWYPKRVSALLGFEIVRAENGSLDATKLTRQLLATGRPLFFTDWIAPGAEKRFLSFPLGNLIRVVATPEELPPPDVLLDLNQHAFADLRIETDPPRRKDTWAWQLERDYERPWRVLAGVFRGMGKTELAEACEKRALELSPPPLP